jgi:hypothetical protein
MTPLRRTHLFIAACVLCAGGSSCIKRVQVELLNASGDAVEIAPSDQPECHTSPGETCRFWYTADLQVKRQGQAAKYQFAPVGGGPWLASRGFLTRVMSLRLESNGEIHVLPSSRNNTPPERQPDGWPAKPGEQGAVPRGRAGV